MLLAQATQAKPYMVISTLTLLLILLIQKSSQSLEQKLTPDLIPILLVPIFATATHVLGAFLFFPALAYLFLRFRLLWIRIIVSVLFGALGWYLFFHTPGFHNHWMHFKSLWFRQYGVITALFSLWLISRLLSRKHDITVLVLPFLVIPWLLAWNFKIYTHNIRYITPIMATMMTFAPLGVCEILRWVPQQFRRVSAFISCLVVFALLLPKLTLIPRQYYSPNLDFYGDVQVANYKEFAHQIKTKYGSISQATVIAPISFYGHSYYDYGVDLYLVRQDDPLDLQSPIGQVVSTLPQMLKFIRSHPSGYLLVEKWHSLVPDDIQEYAAKNMTRLIEIKSLPLSPEDPWPLELYQWGKP